MTSNSTVNRPVEATSAEDLFIGASVLLGIFIAYRTLAYAPFLFMAPLTREAIIGIVPALVVGAATSALLIFWPRALAHRLGLGGEAAMQLPPIRELLALGMVLVGVSTVINSSFAMISSVSALVGGMPLPRFEIYTRLAPVVLGLVLILGAWPISGWFVSRWDPWIDDEEPYPEDEEIS